MDYKLITEREYEQMMQKLTEIESVVKDKMDPLKKIFTNEDFCSLMGISKRTCQHWRDQKWIEFSQVSNKIFYTWDQIEAFLEKHKVDV